MISLHGMSEQVILVNENDEELGSMDKMEAHVKGLLHRAFSVFLFDDKGNMLLQQRALDKYHSPGLWTNACCSHPQPGEETLQAANRRLNEELGIHTNLFYDGHLLYRTDASSSGFENGLIEHEFDHLFSGTYNGNIPFNPAEVNAVRWVSMQDLKEEMNISPENFTFWFKRVIAEKY